MRVVVPYTITVEPCREALERFAPGAEHVDVTRSPNAYSELVGGLWADGWDFTLVEHDIEINRHFSELAVCPRPWCAFVYDHGPNGHGRLMPAFGCTRFRAEIMRAVPEIAQLRWPWESLDSKVKEILEGEGFTIHEHRPPVTHHHSWPNIGSWARMYSGVTEPRPYGGLASYERAGRWMRGCATVEDWGCGLGWMRRYVSGTYRGIDGSPSPFTDYVGDLERYRSKAEGIILRHVLEHNYGWATILDNAVASATKRLVIVLFTPLAERTTVLMTEPDYQSVPVISFALGDILGRLPDTHTIAQVPGSHYGTETVIEVWVN